MKKQSMHIALDTKRYWWVSITTFLLLICYAHWQVITALYQQWVNNEDYSHGLLIIPISAYFTWKKRAELACAEIKTDWHALLLILLAIGVNIIGELGTDIFTIRLSILLLFLGCIWLSLGRDVLRILRFPLVFLFLMLPLPGFLYRNITFPLQLLSSKMSVDLLNMIGILAYREGNIIDMGFARFEVVEACNGIRFIMPLFTVGVLFAFSKRRRWWERLILVSVTVPLAILANIIRISGTGFLSTIWGPKVAEGFFHSFSGWTVFMGCFVIFLLVDKVLKRMSRGDGGKGGSLTRNELRKGGMRVSALPILIAFLFILSAHYMVDNLGSVKPVELKKSLAEFPLEWKGWNGKPYYMDEEMWDQVGAQEYVMIQYQQPGKASVDFYSAFYEYQRKLGDFVHSPKLCLPGAGWYIHESRVRELEYAQSVAGIGRKLKFNEILVEKDNNRQLVYYWYQGRDRNLASEYLTKFFLAFDGVFRRRTDGALVRLITPVSDLNEEQEARETLDSFALYVSEALGGYFP